MTSKDLSQRKFLNIVGIMSGTSLDGVDFVFARLARQERRVEIKFLDQDHSRFPRALLADLKLCARHQATTDVLAQTHYRLGRFYAQAAQRVLARKNWRVDAFGLHGQTVYHGPQATLQIGESSLLALSTGRPVIDNFRAADVMTGGQGAPLAPILHFHLACSLPQGELPVGFQNLGGIGNVTFIGGRHRRQVMAFDTGPANMLIDQVVQKNSRHAFDKGGRLAEKGLVHHDLVERWMKEDKYFHQRPPKSCGREEFGEGFFRRIQRSLKRLSFHDQVATVSELTALSIARSYRDFLPKRPTRVFLCGGGAKNQFLKFRLQYHLPTTQVVTTDELGWPVDAIEGGAFALLAGLHIWGRPGNIRSATGSQSDVVLGAFAG